MMRTMSAQNVEGGRQLTEEEITGLLIAVLFAGQHTSSITSSWTGLFMIDSKVGAACACARVRVGEKEFCVV
jgi:sterol 14-demethylase